MPDIPIIGHTGNGRPAPKFATAHVVELHTTDGGRHRLPVEFSLPTGPDGAVQLDALAGDFNPVEHVNRNMLNLLAKAYASPQLAVAGTADGAQVVLVHVAAFRYLGSADEVEQADRDAGTVRGAER